MNSASVLAGHRRMRHQQRRLVRHQRDRREVAQRVVGQRLVQRRIGGMADVHHEQRVAVGRGLRHQVAADDTARAAAVLDH